MVLAPLPGSFGTSVNIDNSSLRYYFRHFFYYFYFLLFFIIFLFYLTKNSTDVRSGV